MKTAGIPRVGEQFVISYKGFGFLYLVHSSLFSAGDPSQVSQAAQAIHEFSKKEAPRHALTRNPDLVPAIKLRFTQIHTKATHIHY